MLAHTSGPIVSCCASAADLTKDQAEQVQADDEHERDESKPEPNWPWPSSQAHGDSRESRDQGTHLSYAHHCHPDANEPRPRHRPQDECGDAEYQRRPTAHA